MGKAYVQGTPGSLSYPFITYLLERKRELLFIDLLLKCLLQPGSGQAKDRCLGFHLDLPDVWQAFKYLNSYPLPPRVSISRKLELKTEPGCKPWYSSMGCGCLKCYHKHGTKCLSLARTLLLLKTVVEWDRSRKRGCTHTWPIRVLHAL